MAWVDAANAESVGGDYQAFGFAQEERMFLTEIWLYVANIA